MTGGGVHRREATWSGLRLNEVDNEFSWTPSPNVVETRMERTGPVGNVNLSKHQNQGLQFSSVFK